MNKTKDEIECQDINTTMTYVKWQDHKWSQVFEKIIKNNAGHNKSFINVNFGGKCHVKQQIYLKEKNRQQDFQHQLLLFIYNNKFVLKSS